MFIQILPEVKNTGHNLRKRVHPYNLPDKDDRNFFNRLLYLGIVWTIFIHCILFCLYVTILRFVRMENNKRIIIKKKKKKKDVVGLIPDIQNKSGIVSFHQYADDTQLYMLSSHAIKEFMTGFWTMVFTSTHLSMRPLLSRTPGQNHSLLWPSLFRPSQLRGLLSNFSHLKV